MSDRHIVRVYEERTIHDKVAELGESLAQEEETPVIVSMIGGSVIFLADLVRAIARPLRYGFIQVQYSDGADGMMDLTALGDTVNTAARLQGMARGGEAILGEPVCADIRLRHPGVPLQEVMVKGRTEPVSIRTLRVQGSDAA